MFFNQCAVTNWNYDEIVKKLDMGRIDVDAAEIPLVLEEARKRCDVNVIEHVASWYEDVKDDKARYLELAKESAKKRFGFARQRLAVL